MADTARTSLLSPEAMGSFDAEGNYTPRTIVDDDLGDADLEKAMGDSIIEFDDGDVIEGTVVKIDRDLLRHYLDLSRPGSFSGSGSLCPATGIPALYSASSRLMRSASACFSFGLPCAFCACSCRAMPETL